MTPNNDGFSLEHFMTYSQEVYRQDTLSDAKQTDRLNRHRHLEPESAKFLASLTVLKQPRKLLEIGTSTGFSTLWLAYALQDIDDARLISIDIDPTRSDIAQAHLDTVHLSAKVDLQVSDAQVFLSQNSDKFELIFLDAERRYYLDYVALLHRSLALHGVLIVDNVISHTSQVRDFLISFENDPRYLCQTIAVGAGLFIAVRHYA